MCILIILEKLSSSTLNWNNGHKENKVLAHKKTEHLEKIENQKQQDTTTIYLLTVDIRHCTQLRVEVPPTIFQTETLILTLTFNPMKAMVLTYKLKFHRTDTDLSVRDAPIV